MSTNTLNHTYSIKLEHEPPININIGRKQGDTMYHIKIGEAKIGNAITGNGIFCDNISNKIIIDILVYPVIALCRRGAVSANCTNRDILSYFKFVSESYTSFHTLATRTDHSAVEIAVNIIKEYEGQDQKQDAIIRAVKQRIQEYYIKFEYDYIFKFDNSDIYMVIKDYRPQSKDVEIAFYKTNSTGTELLNIYISCYGYSMYMKFINQIKYNIDKIKALNPYYVNMFVDCILTKCVNASESTIMGELIIPNMDNMEAINIFKTLISIGDNANLLRAINKYTGGTPYEINEASVIIYKTGEYSNRINEPNKYYIGLADINNTRCGVTENDAGYKFTYFDQNTTMLTEDDNLSTSGLIRSFNSAYNALNYITTMNRVARDIASNITSHYESSDKNREDYATLEYYMKDSFIFYLIKGWIDDTLQMRTYSTAFSINDVMILELDEDSNN